MTLMERCRCRITKRPCSGNRHFEGLMDELVICDRDLTAEESQELMRQRYGEYLTRLKDEAYRDHVFAYVEKEDTPRPLLFQLDLLRQVGFSQVEVLHKNVCFAAFGAVKG